MSKKQKTQETTPEIEHSLDLLPEENEASSQETQVAPKQGFDNPTAERVEAPKRTLKGTQDVYHDLFVLDVANMPKDISFTEKEIIENFPHKHHYHSVNSDGVPQDKSSPALGHFHFITQKVVDGKLIAECGPAMKFGVKVVKKKGKSFKKKAILMVEEGQHTHDVIYKHSEVFKQRTFSKEAMESISAIANHEASLLKNPTL